MFNTIKELHAALLKKEINCVDLVNFNFKNINKQDSTLNAMITISDDEAYRKAKSMDNVIKKLGDRVFKEFPLIGVTVIHKDMFLTKGIRTTAGSKLLSTYVPQYSATVVERLSDAGAIIMGKANQDAWAHGSSGENSDFGPSKNPWDVKRVPGGSSSGSAVAVACNYSMIATGTDTCGSIRLPANFCGVVGYKPTYGLVSRYGVIAMASSLDSVGHFTKTVEDSELVYETTSGIDMMDSTLKEERYKLDNRVITIGIPKEFFEHGVDGEIRDNVYEAIEVFKKLGYRVKDVSLPTTKYGISVYYIIQPAEVSSNLGRYDGIRFGDGRDAFSDEAKRRIMLGSYVLSAGYYDDYYLKAMKVRSVIINELNKVFSEVDVLIAPISPTPPFKLGEKTDNPLKMYLSDVLAATANLSGIPAIAIPTKLNSKNLPLGFQLMGQKFSDKLLFEIGKNYQKNINYKPLSKEINI